jgi:hypothetical protein
MRKIFLIVGLVLLAIGLVIFLFDAYTSSRYGFHMNEVAGLADNGEPIDWATGERPTFTLIPIFVYALGFWLAAAGVFSLRFRVGRCYHARICRGTE